MTEGCEVRAPLDCDTSMKEGDTLCETWGLYHSPEEFVAKAVEAGHPHGMKQCIPQILSKAVRRNHELSTARRAEYRV